MKNGKIGLDQNQQKINNEKSNTRNCTIDDQVNITIQQEDDNQHRSSANKKDLKMVKYLLMKFMNSKLDYFLLGQKNELKTASTRNFELTFFHSMF